MKGLVSGWSRPCDNCHTTSTLIYCRADAAFLCGPCDSKIHVGVHHERVWMCEVCEQAPASVTCKADAAVMCLSCDHDIHSANPLASRHERVPVVPFIHSAVDAVVRSTGTSDTGAKFEEEDSDARLIPNLNNPFLYGDSNILDFVTRSGEDDRKQLIQQQNYEDRSIAVNDSVVPTQSNAELSFSNASERNFANSFDIDFSQPDKHHIKKNQHLEPFGSFNFSAQHSVSSSETGVVPEGNMNSSPEISYAFGNAGTGDAITTAVEFPTTAVDRAARVLRYREKRKNRKFEKTVRYASRKAYAEKRPRIKGRFVKRSGNGNGKISDVDQVFEISPGADSRFDCVFDQGYGVVPTF